MKPQTIFFACFPLVMADVAAIRIFGEQLGTGLCLVFLALAGAAAGLMVLASEAMLAKR